MDYGVMVFVTEVFHIHYTISIVIGGMVGALVNFALNKTWTFKDKQRGYAHGVFTQLFKFACMVLGSIALKSAGTYLLTNWLHIDYKITRIMIDLVVSLAFNYTLQRFWVFRKMQITRLEHMPAGDEIRKSLHEDEIDR